MMTDIVAFKGTGFYGTLEIKEKFAALSKNLQLERLKAVRCQEREIARKRCASYRECIDARKLDKTNVIKNERKQEQYADLAALKRKASAAQQESGAAHRLAKASSDKAMKENVEKTKLALRRANEDMEREIVALKIRQDELLTAQAEAHRQRSLQQVKKEFRQSEREDAHAIGETYAARQSILDAQRAALDNLHSVPTVYTQRKVQQGAVSIEQRFPVAVRARVVRHGVRQRDETVIRNGAHVEEVTILRKNWQLVMKEMVTRIRTRVRAKAAHRTVERHRGVQFLDSELQQLEAADKAPGRQFRLNSALDVVPDVESPQLQHTFERIFLNKPVRLDNQQAVYRTGSQLMRSELDRRAGNVDRQGEQPMSPHPSWAAAAPGFSRPPPLSTIHSDTASQGSTRSSVDTGMGSDEMDGLYRRRMYEDLVGRGTMQDIPDISRAPPQFAVKVAPSSPESVSAPFASSPDPLQRGPAGRPPLRRGEGLSQAEARNASPLQASSQLGPSLTVRMPQVGDASRSLSQPDDSLLSSSDSTTSSVQRVNLSGSGDGSDADVLYEEGPLSIQVRPASSSPGALELSGSVTPPRHTSSRLRGPTGGMIDPFTPPEVHQPKPPVAAAVGTASADGPDSPQSGTSSTDTERARHDRLPAHFQQTSRPQPVLQNRSTGSSQSPHISGWESVGSSYLERSALSSSGIAASEEPEESAEVSMLSEQSLPPAQAAELSHSALQDSSGSVLTNGSGHSSRASRSTADRSRSAASAGVGTTPSSSTSATSSSSSSMMSYPQASPYPVPRPPTAPVAMELPAISRYSTSPEMDEPALRSASVSRSLQSDSVSVVSAISEDSALRNDRAQPQAHRGASLASLHLTRQQVRDVLRDLGSDSEVSDGAVEAEGNGKEALTHPPRVTVDSVASPKGTHDVGKQASPYDSMYDSWEEDQHLSIRIGTASSMLPAPRPAMYAVAEEDGEEEKEPDKEPVQQPTTRFASGREGPVRMALGDDEESESGSSDGGSGADTGSVHSETTSELFEKWQSLYQGSVHIGDAARALRSVHVAAYNNTSISSTSRVDDTSFMLDVSAPASAAPKAMEVASPLDVLVRSAPPVDPLLILHSHGRARTASSASNSSDSLAPRSAQRESYDFSHAESVISALDKLSADWQGRGTGPAPQLRTFAAPSTLHRTPVSGQGRETSAQTQPFPAEGHELTSGRNLSSSSPPSSLSGRATPPEQDDFPVPVPVAAASAAPTTGSVRPQPAVYQGRLVVHTERRPATSVSDLAAQLGLDDSLLSSDSEVGYAGPSDPRALLSSDEEGDDPSLEELLRGPHPSEHTMGALRQEFSGLLDRMRSAGGSASGARPIPATQATALPTTTGVPSSGEETYSSGRYYSAGENQNTSSSTMHTAATSASAVRPSQAASELDQRPARAAAAVTVATSSLTVHSSTRRTVTSTQAVSASAQRTAIVASHRSEAGVVSPASDSFSSPTATSASRLSEYAMLSQHTLHTTMRTGSPGSPVLHTLPRPTFSDPEDNDEHSF